MRFDHLLHWVPDPDAAQAQYQALGFHVAPGGQHPGRGTQNRLCHFGLPYVELLSIHDRAQAERSNLSAMLPAVDALLAEGGGARMFAVSVDDLDATLARLREAGLVLGEVFEGARQRPDGSFVTWRTARLADGPAWRPFFIEWGTPLAEREADLRRRGILRSPQDRWALQQLVVETPEPQAGLAWLSRALGLPVRSLGADGDAVPLPGCHVAVRAGPVDRISQLEFAGEGPVGHAAGIRFERWRAQRAQPLIGSV